jgi:hypothetical protein
MLLRFSFPSDHDRREKGASSCSTSNNKQAILAKWKIDFSFHLDTEPHYSNPIQSSFSLCPSPTVINCRAWLSRTRELLVIQNRFFPSFIHKCENRIHRDDGSEDVFFSSLRLYWSLGSSKAFWSKNNDKRNFLLMFILRQEENSSKRFYLWKCCDDDFD